MWYRVFGLNEQTPDPAAFAADGRISADEQDWYRIEFGPLCVERYLATEDGIRAQLNTWAAWIETQDTPYQASLMQRMIGTKQLFTIQGPLEQAVALCQFLAGATDGVYQVDGQGFFTADGKMLVSEEPCAGGS